jgi:hypothetical protein
MLKRVLEYPSLLVNFVIIGVCHASLVHVRFRVGPCVQSVLHRQDVSRVEEGFGVDVQEVHGITLLSKFTSGRVGSDSAGCMQTMFYSFTLRGLTVPMPKQPVIDFIEPSRHVMQIHQSGEWKDYYVVRTELDLLHCIRQCDMGDGRLRIVEKHMGVKTVYTGRTSY